MDRELAVVLQEVRKTYRRDGQEQRSANASRLVVRNAISLFYSLPLTYKDRTRSTTSAWGLL